MSEHADKLTKNTLADNRIFQQPKSEGLPQLDDNRHEAITQRRLQDLANNNPRVQQLKSYQQMADEYTSQPLQKRVNHTAVAQLVLDPEAVAPGVHKYTVEDVNLRGKKQAPEGHYRHIGDKKFVQVTNNGTGVWERNGTDFYWYEERSRILCLWENARAPSSIDAVDWAAAATKKSNNGGAIGRAVADQYQLAWVLNPEMPNERARAIEIVGHLPIPELPAWTPQWKPVQTIAGSPVMLMIQDVGDDFSGRNFGAGGNMLNKGDVEKVWNEVESQSARVKSSNVVTPMAPMTSRTNRPTDRDFGVSATFAQTGKDNALEKGELAPFEWCHLIGDGDRGDNSSDNLNAGTNAVNTEQLLLETVQRSAGLRDVLKANSMTLKIQAKGILANIPEDDNIPWQQQHVGNWFRYTISIHHKNGSALTVIDHAMDGQRQKITKLMVRLMMSEAKSLIISSLQKLGVNANTAEVFPVKKNKLIPGIAASPASASSPQSSVEQINVIERLVFLQGRSQLTPDTVKELIVYGYQQHYIAEGLERIGLPVKSVEKLMSAAVGLLVKTPEQLVEGSVKDAAEGVDMHLNEWKGDLMRIALREYNKSLSELPPEVTRNVTYPLVEVKYREWLILQVQTAIQARK